MTGPSIDFGSGVIGRYFVWDPELDINPQYQKWADQLPVNPAGLILDHPDQRDPSKTCTSSVNFNVPVFREVCKAPMWEVESFDPLTLSPSIHCVLDWGGCGLHGFIRAGKWESC